MIIIGWFAFGASALLLLLGQWSLSLDMYWLKRHVARFPMFAVRDRLVRLVANGQMREDDPVWAIVYFTVNHQLDFNRNSSPWALVAEHMRYSRRKEHERDVIDGIGEVILERCLSIPDFGSALVAFDRSMVLAARQQAHWWDRVGLVALAMVLRTLLKDPVDRCLGDQCNKLLDGHDCQARPNRSGST